MMEVSSPAEQHVEVHHFHAGVVTLVVIVTLALEAFLPVRFPRAAVIELPLLVTIYFALSRRNPVSGMLLGMIIGLAQDSLSHTPIGLYGISKTVVGYVASSVGARIDTEHPFSRFALTFVFFHIHNIIFVMARRVLLAQQQAYWSRTLLIVSLLNAAVAMILFSLLDRLRKSA